MKKNVGILVSLVFLAGLLAQNDDGERNFDFNQNMYSDEYDFAPDVGSPGVEVAPLDVNAEDEDVPYPNETTEGENADDEED